MTNTMQPKRMQDDDSQAETHSVPHGFSVQKQRVLKRKPRRGTIPVQVCDSADDEPFAELQARMEDAINRARNHLEAGEIELLEQAKREQVQIAAALDQIFDRADTVGMAPVQTVHMLNPLVALAMQLLAETQYGRPIAEPIPLMDRDRQIEILRHFKHFFGIKIGDAWVIPYLDLVHRARLEELNAQVAPRRDDPRGRTYVSSIPSDLVKRGEWILDETRAAMTAWPIKIQTPTWLDAKLTAFIVGRYGFSNGGGPRVSSRKTLTHLLGTPAALAKDLAKSPDGKNRFRETLARLEISMSEAGDARTAIRGQ